MYQVKVLVETTRLLSVFLTVETSHETGQKNMFIYLVYNRDMEADRNCARLPA